jgi:hypothetical protein
VQFVTGQPTVVVFLDIVDQHGVAESAGSEGEAAKDGLVVEDEQTSDKD